MPIICSLYHTNISSVNSYGDMPAHNLLWRECDKTSDNVAARLAAIPLVQVGVFLYLLIILMFSATYSLIFSPLASITSNSGS